MTESKSQLKRITIQKGAKPPQTEKEWAAYRCQSSCEIGRKALDGKIKSPNGVTALEYAVFNMLHAIEELSKIK